MVGSFLALVTVRLPRGEEVVQARSRCMSCETPLNPLQMIPVVSWLWLRGRCGRCKAKVSPRYPLIEVSAAAIGVWAALRGGDGTLIAATAILGWQLLLIAIIDAENFWLPDILTWPLVATGLTMAAALTHAVPWPQIVGTVGGFASLWLLAWTYKRVRGRDGLGGGDPFLFAGAGAWVGWIGLPSVLLWACAAGFSILAARLVTRRSVSGGDRVPFGTFLAIGIWLTWQFGPLGL
jgi:leader peptidase (prepilin peptidase)/N-methyltransferase